MPPKKNKKNQDDDDELDKKFEQQQALLNKQANKQQNNQDQQEDEQQGKKGNIFEQIKHVAAADVQQPKKKKDTKEPAKTEQKQEQKKGKKDEKVELKEIKKRESTSDQEEEEERVNDSDSHSEEEEHQYQHKHQKKSQALFPEEEGREEIGGCCGSSHGAQAYPYLFNEQDEKKNKKKAKDQKDKEKAKEKSEKKEKSKSSEKDEELFKNSKNENHCDPLIVIFLIGTLILMFVFKYYGDNYRRYNYADTSENLYLVLEVEPSASAQELRNSYKRLANLWHPDKNHNCGESCKEKFYKITEAWKILGNPKNRETYDSAHGVLQMIKSKAVTLTGANYDSLVLQSTDVWIIQVYMNGDDGSKRMSPFWESLINNYGHVVKFGRIDAENDTKLVQRLPFASPIFPTIFSFSHYSSPTLATINSFNVEGELTKFVQKAVVSKLKLLKQDNAAELFKQFNLYEPNKKIDIIYLFASDRIPIEFKYAALQNSKELNFYTNSFGQQQNVQKIFKTTKNFMVFINDEEKQVRVKYEFDFGKSFNSEKFYKILNYLNFRVTPELAKESFKYYCKNQQTNQDGETQLENDYQTLCIFLFKQSPHYVKYLELANKYKKQYKSQSIEKFTSGERIFDNYHNIQFVSIDLDKHWRFRNVLEAYLNDPKFKHTLKSLHAAAFLEENKKISLLQNVNEFEDWVLDLQDNLVDFEYLTDYLPTADESSLFLFSDDTPLKLFFKSLVSNAIDYKTIITVIFGFIGLLVKYDSYIALTYTVSLFFLSVTSLAVFESYEDFLNVK